MVENPSVYLLALALLSAVIHFLYKRLFVEVHTWVVMVLLCISAYLLTLGGVFSHDPLVLRVTYTTLQNLLPALVFLTLLRVDFSTLQRVLFGVNTIGCACEMGAKRYWVLVVLSLGVSLFSQVLVFRLGWSEPYVSVVFSALLGFLARYTVLRELNGVLDVARTMAYMVSSLFGVVLGM